jgi:hypothetical protein
MVHLLFETRAGDLLLALLERLTGRALCCRPGAGGAIWSLVPLGALEVRYTLTRKGSQR